MKKLILSLAVIGLLIMTSCGSGNSGDNKGEGRAKDIGIGPIDSVTLGEIDESLAETGKETF